ncbi:uncharacterized protein LOC121870256 [Homarus americanus]|uniref:uncharacterized protein LOC121870256 n=1 Tax=Homarus americanus TaxID=6706 RepID=UPI001C465563|nr:uncharacterized protein LOC121870256 [Homarus americanus]
MGKNKQKNTNNSYGSSVAISGGKNISAGSCTPENLGYVVLDGERILIATASNEDHKVHFENDYPPPPQTKVVSVEKVKRQRDENRQRLLKDTVVNTQKYLVQNNTFKVAGLVIAGPGHLKEQVVQMLPEPTKRMVKAVLSTGNSGKQGLKEALRQTKNLLGKLKTDASNSVLDEIFTQLKCGNDQLVSFGDEVREVVEAGAARVVCVWKDCPSRPWFVENCMYSNTKVFILTEPTETSKTLVKTFSGVAALHHYNFSLHQSLAAKC